MATEKVRGCGYRKIGATYLVAGKRAWACGGFPITIAHCATCSYRPGFNGYLSRIRVGYLRSRWSRRICRRAALVGAEFCRGCLAEILNPLDNEGLVGLCWIRRRHYPTGAAFLDEWSSLGVCKRVGWPLPKWHVLGETWLFLAHEKGAYNICESCGTPPYVLEGAPRGQGCDRCNEEGVVWSAAFIGAFRAERVERIIPDTMHPEARARLEKEGLTLVEVPAGDNDHRETSRTQD